MVVRRRKASMVASEPSTAAICGFSSSGSWSMARTTPRSAICNCPSGQEIDDALGAGDGGLLGAVGEVDADLLELGIAAEGIEAGDGEVELAADAAQELVAVAALGVDDGAVVLDDLLQVAVERRPCRDLTVPMRPLTKSEANLKRPASSSRILRRGPSPGPLLGQDLPLSRSTTAFSEDTVVSCVERRLQLLEPRRGGEQRGLHLA